MIQSRSLNISSPAFRHINHRSVGEARGSYVASRDANGGQVRVAK